MFTTFDEFQEQGKSIGLNRLAATVLLVLMALAYLALIVLHIKTASVWSQITDLIGENPASLLSQGSAHALRFGVMLPVLIVAQYTHINRDLVFSYEIWAMTGLIGCTLGKVVAILKTGSTNSWQVHALWPSLFFWVLALAQNGRIVVAMMGFAIMLLVQTRYRSGLRRNPFLCIGAHALCLLLMSVSSGTFVVGMAEMIAFIYCQTLYDYPRVKSRDLVLLAFGGVILLSAVPLTITFAIKNIDYYGGGIEGAVQLLEHGAGAFLINLGPIVLVAAPIIVAVLYGLEVFFKRQLAGYRLGKLNGPVLTGIVVSLCFGMFGFSTLTMGLLPLVVCASLVKLSQPETKLQPAIS